MTIYGEYLFIENFITTLLLLLLTGKLTGYIPNKSRLILGSTLGAISSFMLVVSMPIWISIMLRIGAGAMCALLTFGRQNILAVATVYFLLTFASGGMVMAILLWMQESAINHQGIVYMESVTYFRLLSMGILAFGFTYWFIKLVRKRSIGTSVMGTVSLVIENKEYTFRAYVDSGNSLKEPLSGKPVVLIDRKGAEKLPFEPSNFPKRYGLIPYKAVGVDYGVLEGIRTDEIIYDKCIFPGAYLAFYEGIFGEYEILLNKDFLEGGLLEKYN